MKTTRLLLMTAVALGGVPLLAQMDASDASESAKTTYAPTAGGFGDQSASRSWEMMDVSAQLQGKLNSKTAKVGDRVALKIADKVQSSDGMVIPKGTLLVGHITQVQAHDSDRAIAQIAIAFDHAEMKGGQSVQVHSLIRTVRPSGSEMGMSRLDSDDQMNAGMGGGRMSARGGGGGLGNVDPLGSNAGIAGDAGRVGGGSANGTVDRNGNPAAGGAGTVPNTGAAASAQENGEVQLAGHGDQWMRRLLLWAAELRGRRAVYTAVLQCTTDGRRHSSRTMRSGSRPGNPFDSVRW
jgi:hypothetical protein